MGDDIAMSEQAILHDLVSSWVSLGLEFAAGTPGVSALYISVSSERGSIFANVCTLEKKGLVDRHVDPADGRARRVMATAAGIEKAQAANSAVEAADEGFFGPHSRLPLPLFDHLAHMDR
ncbi:hypothetical protein AB1K54_10390 [Microbacterium sp. BWT-B31]|uniref:MarR family winged helix-turn-helix transcriptional regulator n=1 Tax=Microbacterium sp. BWT-B31 TaxID=3232072 RepID=UPI003526CF80